MKIIVKPLTEKEFELEVCPVHFHFKIAHKM